MKITVVALLCILILLLPDATDGVYRRGVALIEQGRPDLAVELLRRAVELEPRNAQYQKALAVSFAMQKRYSEADEPFSHACSLQPALPNACYFYARNLYALDRFEASLDVLQKALRTDPRPWRVWLAIAQADQGLGHAVEAEKEFRTAIRLHGTVAPATLASEDPRVYFGSFLFREGRVDEARSVLAELLAARPDSARGHLELGRVELQSGSVAAAEEHFRRAVQLGAGEQAQLLLDKALARRRALGQ